MLFVLGGTAFELILDVGFPLAAGRAWRWEAIKLAKEEQGREGRYTQ